MAIASMDNANSKSASISRLTGTKSIAYAAAGGIFSRFIENGRGPEADKDNFDYR